MKKLIYVILDGAADLPNKELKGKTPLESAEKPYLDSLAKFSKLGLMSVVRNDIAPESDEAMLALLGYDPFEYHRGRGPLEALGADVIHEIKNQVILRCNFAREENGFITNTGVKPSPKEMKVIVNLLNKHIDSVKGIKTRFIPTVGHRAVLILEGDGLSARVTNANPAYILKQGFVTSALPKINLRYSGCKALDKTPKSVRTAQIINSWAEAAMKILQSHKFEANLVLLRGAGDEFPELPSLIKKWVLLADMPVENAIGKLCGMKVLKKPGNLKKCAQMILENFSSYDCFYIEIKGPDSFAHQGDPAGKKISIEDIDRDFFKPLLSKVLNQNTSVRICVTSDHTTACATKSHTSDPVPVLIYDPGEKGDGINKFGEFHCAQGSLHFTSGTQLFEMLTGK